MTLCLPLLSAGAADIDTPPAEPATSPPLPSQPSLLLSPLPHTQVIFGFYDRRFSTINGKEHLGVDLAAPAGTAVSLICDATVVSNNTQTVDIVSAVVMVEHDCPPPLGKVYGYYGHVLSELRPGEIAAAGSLVGTVRDWGGNSHLHLGLSTQLMSEAWGLQQKGMSLQALQAMGWLNPLDFLSFTAAGGARPAAVRKPLRKTAPHANPRLAPRP